MTTPTLPQVLPFDWGITVSVSSDVPGRYPFSLNGRPYLIDDGQNSGWAHQGIEQIRTQADSSLTYTQASLNPKRLWRRNQESWHRGAGQTYLDKLNGDDFRYSSSKGIDPWTPYQASLLPSTDQKLSGSSTNYRLEPAGTRLYLSDNQTLKYTTNIVPDTPSWSSVTGTAAAAITGLCSDGYNVYLAQGASGIYLTNTGSTSASSWATGTVAGPIAFVKGRLMAANGASIYNVIAAGALPTALFTHGISTWTWVGFAEGTAAIYAAGYAGDKSLIYRIAVKPDGSALDAPIVAGSLPDGEVIASIGGYLGFVFLGTSLGVRFCEPDAQGNLTIGELIPTATSVLWFEGQGRFVWFGWTAYDASSTGLGRLDLTEFTEDPITGGRKPAYASDLMTAGSGAILSIATFQTLRVFTVSASGVFAEDPVLVASGTLTAGNVGFGLPDDKIAIGVITQTAPLIGSYSVDMATNSAVATTVGSTTSANSVTTTYPLNYVTGQLFNLTFTLNRDGTTTTAGPTLVRWTLQAVPGANDGPSEYLMVPVLLHSMLRLKDNSEVTCDVRSERALLKTLRQNRTVVAAQDITTSYQVIVENYEWHPEELKVGPDGAYMTEDGTLLLQLKRIA